MYYASNMLDVPINMEFIWWSFTARFVVTMTVKDALSPWRHPGYLKLYLNFLSGRFFVGLFLPPCLIPAQGVLDVSGVTCDEWHRKLKVWSQSTRAADASAQSDRVVVVGVVDSRWGVHHVELFSWEQPGSSQCNSKCKIYLCSSRAVSLLTCSERACSLYRGNWAGKVSSSFGLF